jgi:hypothetical protein
MTTSCHQAAGWRVCALFLFLLLPAKVRGQMTVNHGIQAVPAPQDKATGRSAVVIDGNLADWDRSGAILICSDVRNLRPTESVTLAMMYDAERIYLAASFKDPTPLRNGHVQTDFNGWAGDCLQAFLRFPDRIASLVAWYDAGNGRPALQLGYGKDPDHVFGGPQAEIAWLEDGRFTGGAEMAFRSHEDGAGYDQEMAIPWSLLTATMPQPGDRLTGSFIGLWGDGRRSRPVSRAQDNVLPDHVPSVDLYNRLDAWGAVQLSRSGNLQLPTPPWDREEAATTISNPVTIGYRLPADGPLPQTYRVTLAITAPDDPDWIVSTFVAGGVRTVTAANQGHFTDTWDGLDDNFMPVPPGEYGVKGIVMPAEVWEPDGKPHTLRPRYLSGPNALMPKRGRNEQGPLITGDQCAPGMGDIAVGPDGVAVFYWKFLENAQNPYRVDLSRPLGPEQLLGGFGSGGTGGGDFITTDGEAIWGVAPTDSLVHLDGQEGRFIYPPFLYRADQKPFGNDNMIRRNVTLTQGLVTGLAAWRSEPAGRSLLFVAERGQMAVVDSYHNLDLYAESPTERVNVLRVFDGDTAAELSSMPAVEPTALVVANDRLYLMENRDGGWTVRYATPPTDGLLEAVLWTDPVSLPGLRDPRDLAVDSQNRFYVADRAVNRVFRFTADGAIDHTFGRLERQPEAGYDPTSFMQPTRVVCWQDNAGKDRLLVAESGGPSRVTEWTPDGELLRDWGYSLAGNGGFAVDPEAPEHVYVSGANHTFLRYDVDYQSGDWTLEKVWHDIDTTGLTYPEIINCGGRKYLAFKRFGRGVNLWRFAGDRLLPSAGIRKIKTEAGPARYEIWHDADGDGERSDAEVRPLEMPKGFDRYWGDYRQQDLSLLVPRAGTPDLYRLPVKDFDAHGNPIHGDWERVLTDEVYAAKAAGTATAIRGGNEAVDAFNGDWGSARQTPSGDIVINMRGGGFSANHGWQQKLSRYVPDGAGGFRQLWRTGRAASIVPEPGGVHGSIHVTQPLHGLVGIVDQSRGGMHVYDWESGLYVDTLMLPGQREYDSVYGTPGEYFVGAAHEADGKVYLRWGKTLPWLFEVEGWNTANGISPLTTLPETIAIAADQIANPPELALQIRGGAGAARVARLQPLPGSGPLLDGSLVGWESCEPVQFGDKTNRVEVRCGYAQDAVFLRWQVETEAAMPVPPLPAPERIFTHDRPGTTLSFYLQGDAAATGRNEAGRPGDVRIVCGLYDDNGTIRSAAVGLYPRWDGSGEPRPFLYASPGQRTSFAHVGLLPEVELSHQLSADHKRLVLTAVIPRSVLSATVPVLTDGWRTMGNFEVTIGGSRKLWWSNADGSASRETKDEPTEARFFPAAWSQLKFQPLVAGLPIGAWLTSGPWRLEQPPEYTGTQESKQQFQQGYDAAVFPPDDPAVAIEVAAPSARPASGQWQVRTAKPIDHCLYPDEGKPVHTAGCNLFFASVWIWAPRPTEVAIAFPQQHQNNLTVWLDEQQLAETSREQGVYHTVDSPQAVPLASGWNRLRVRGYALGYDLHFGAVLQADPATLWELRLSATPPE